MKINDIRTIALSYKCEPPYASASGVQGRRGALLPSRPPGASARVSAILTRPTPCLRLFLPHLRTLATSPSRHLYGS